MRQDSGAPLLGVLFGGPTGQLRHQRIDLLLPLRDEDVVAADQHPYEGGRLRVHPQRQQLLGQAVGQEVQDAGPLLAEPGGTPGLDHGAGLLLE